MVERTPSAPTVKSALIDCSRPLLSRARTPTTRSPSQLSDVTVVW